MRSVLWTLVLAAALVTEAAPRKVITLVFRYDDYANASPMELDRGIVAALRESGVPCTFAVVPSDTPPNGQVDPEVKLNPLKPEKVALLREAMAAGVVEVAQHGFNHEMYTRKTRAGQARGEFNERPFADQRLRIAKGKRSLEELLGVRIETFVPPFNTYDLDTARALEELGFRTLSASFRGEAQRESKLCYLPWTRRLWEVKEAVELARRLDDTRPVIVPVFHPDIFREAGGKRTDLKELGALLQWVKKQPDVRALTTAQAVVELDLGVGRYLDNVELRRSLPPNVTPATLLPMDNGVIVSRAFAVELRGKAVWFKAWLFGLGFAGCLALVAWLGRRLFGGRPWAAAGFTLAAGAGVAVAAMHPTDAWAPGARQAAAALAAGLAAGAWAAVAAGRRSRPRAKNQDAGTGAPEPPTA
ncbi:MAG TPA: DUF2334 domain-containing protein [Candidatus Brocadiia bacterium]|nr:DUF2334 domain-containing protein [Candidatus Brocadiia bacterium]